MMQSKAMNTRVMWMLITWSLLLLGNVDRLSGQPATPPEVSVPAVSREANNGSEEGLIPTKSLLGMIREGGVLMIPIGFCSFVSAGVRVRTVRQSPAGPRDSATLRAPVSGATPRRTAHP